MLNFREWLLISETKEEKALASELAGDALTDLSTVIPQNNKNTDKLLLLASYYYSKTKDKEQVKTDMKDYIGYLNRDKMKLINVELASKKPNPPWDDYIYWTQIIHGHQGDDADKEKSKFKPSEDDFQGEVPFMISPDGKIKVFEANSPQQCIILGRGQSFCISQPGNKMWQSYRDTQTSTFYFVYDNTRNDRLGIVVIDQTQYKTVLTDQVNKTGETLDPYTGQLTNDSEPYMKYLKEKGIDTSKLVNIPKSAEEQKEHEELGQSRKELDWFESLSFDYKSKYIGRGHQLTNEQFDYLWKYKFNSLLTQYVKTGLLLSDHQIDKIVTDSDLKKNYIHNRSIAYQHSGNLSDKEYYLFTNFIIENISHPLSKKIVENNFLIQNNEDYVKEIIEKTKNKNEMIKLITANIKFINESIIELLQKYTKDKIEEVIVKNNKFGFLVFSNYYRERIMERLDKIRNYYGQIPKELIKKHEEDIEENIKNLLELLNKSTNPERITSGQLAFHVVGLLMQSTNPIQYKNLIPDDIIKNIDHYGIERLVKFAKKPIEALEVIGKEIVNDKIRIEIFQDLQNFDNEKKLEGAKILLMFTDFLDDRQINFIKKCIEKSTISENNKEEIYNLIEKYKTS